MLMKILIVLGVLAAVLGAVISIQPATYTVQRSAAISAPPAKVYSLVNDFHNWNGWSPWAHLDPDMKQTFEGAASGVGAVYAWSGNDKAGVGRMTILDSQPGERVRIRLEFLKPFASTANVEFLFRPEANGTAVNWTMAGENNFVSKAFSLFMNMDKMIGDDFEKGLAQMKAIAEKS